MEIILRPIGIFRNFNEEDLSLLTNWLMKEYSQEDNNYIKIKRKEVKLEENEGRTEFIKLWTIEIVNNVLKVRHVLDVKYIITFFKCTNTTSKIEGFEESCMRLPKGEVYYREGIKELPWFTFRATDDCSTFNLDSNDLIGREIKCPIELGRKPVNFSESF